MRRALALGLLALVTGGCDQFQPRKQATPAAKPVAAPAPASKEPVSTDPPAGIEPIQPVQRAQQPPAAQTFDFKLYELRRQCANDAAAAHAVMMEKPASEEGVITNEVIPHLNVREQRCYGKLVKTVISKEGFFTAMTVFDVHGDMVVSCAGNNGDLTLCLRGPKQESIPCDECEQTIQRAMEEQ